MDGPIRLVVYILLSVGMSGVSGVSRSGVVWSRVGCLLLHIPRRPPFPLLLPLIVLPASLRAARHIYPIVLFC